MTVNNEKKNRSLLFILIGMFIAISICIGIFFLGGNLISNFIISPETEEAVISTPTEHETEIPQISEDITIADVDLETLFIPFWESYGHLHNYFIDQPIEDEVLAAGAIEGIETYLEEISFNLEDVVVPGDAPGANKLSDEAETPRKAEDEFLAYWELWQKLLYADLDENVAYDLLMQYSLAFMALSLDDPYTSYLDPIQFHANQEVLNPSGYEGIGAWVDTTTEYITVISPMSGSPAERAGLKPGDLIIAIDGEDMTGVDGSLALNKVLGPAGSTVTLTISRAGQEPFDLDIVRAEINTPSFRSEMLDDQIAYIRIYSFSSNSPEEVRESLTLLLEENPKGLILDLRYNPGGYVNQVIQITSEFLTDGVVLYEQYGDGSKDTFEVLPGGIAPDIPMVVLVNEGSASASEILAGALQDYGRATLVGETTFGKGSVLVNIPLSNEQGSISVTIANWLSPDGRHIQDSGIDPDHLVEYTEEDVASGIDPQLEKAIELLTLP